MADPQSGKANQPKKTDHSDTPFALLLFCHTITRDLRTKHLERVPCFKEIARIGLRKDAVHMLVRLARASTRSVVKSLFCGNRLVIIKNTCKLLSYSFSFFPEVAYVMLLAHAKAWHTYDQEFRATQQGKVSIILNTHWGEPKTDKQDDIDAADRSMEWWLGWFAHPVFVNGDWPEIMKVTVKKNSEAKGISNRYERIP